MNTATCEQSEISYSGLWLALVNMLITIVLVLRRSFVIKRILKNICFITEKKERHICSLSEISQGPPLGIM